MLSLFLFFIAVCLVVGFFLWRTLTAPSGLDLNAHARNLDRLYSLVDSDLDSQRISSDDAEDAKNSMKRDLARSLLRQQEQFATGTEEVLEPKNKRAYSFAVLMLAPFLVLCATGASYWLFFGSPGFGDLPLKQRLDRAIYADLSAEGRALAQLASARLAGNPQDVEGLIILAQVHLAVGKREESQVLAERAKALEPDNRQVLDLVNELDREKTFEEAQQRQARNRSGASDDRPGPNQEDVEAAASMSEADRADMINSMVEGLASRLEDEPDDVAGWRQLARAYEVLGNREGLEIALGNLMRLDPRDISSAKQLAALKMSSIAPNAPLSAELIAIFEYIHKQAPNDLEALFFLGVGALQAGDEAQAKERWDQVLSRIPKANPAYEQMQSEMERLLAE